MTGSGAIVFLQGAGKMAAPALPQGGLGDRAGASRWALPARGSPAAVRGHSLLTPALRLDSIVGCVSEPWLAEKSPGCMSQWARPGSERLPLQRAGGCSEKWGLLPRQGHLGQTKEAGGPPSLPSQAGEISVRPSPLPCSQGPPASCLSSTPPGSPPRPPPAAPLFGEQSGHSGPGGVRKELPSCPGWVLGSDYAPDHPRQWRFDWGWRASLPQMLCTASSCWGGAE